MINHCDMKEYVRGVDHIFKIKVLLVVVVRNIC
jgi:hypothetical protein